MPVTPTGDPVPPNDRVTVADLLAQVRGPEGPFVDDQLPIPELLRREGRIEEPPPAVRPKRTYRAVAVAAGLVLVCGVGAASTAALSEPRTNRTMPDPVTTERITGPEVVRPAQVAAMMDFTGTTPADTPPPPRAEDVDPGSDRGGLGEVLDPVLDPVRDPVLGTVTTFYQTAATAPSDAFGLLGPEMQGEGYPSFEESWAGVERVRVDGISGDGRGAALVSVTLMRADGSALHTVARVVVGSGPQRRIEDAALVSAARTS